MTSRRGRNVRQRNEEEHDAPNAYAQLMPDNLHPFMQIASGEPFFNKRNEAMYTIKDKQFVCSRTPDWAPLEQAGVSDDIKATLMQQFLRNDGSVRHEYGDWVKLFNLWAPIYRELCFEFLATVRINTKFEGTDDRTFLQFRLGRVERQMSLLDMANCLGIYTQTERRSSYFSDFLIEGYRIKESIDKDIWGKLSDKPYETSGNYVSSITRTDYRVIQRFLSHSITGRGENTEKVTLMDMWYLDKFDERDIVCIPYCVAWFLAKKASGRTARSPICGGHFITFIAESFNIDFTGLSVVFDPRERVEKIMYSKIKAVRHNGRTFVPYPAPTDEPPTQRQRTGAGTSGSHADAEEEEQAYNQGGFRVATPPPQQTNEAAPPGYLDMMQRFDNFQMENEYRQGRNDYNMDWVTHNTQLYFDNPTNFQPTPHQQIPYWGTQNTGYHPPIYNQENALEEAQRLHQERIHQQEEEARYHEEQRRREHGGFHHDYWPF